MLAVYREDERTRLTNHPLHKLSAAYKRLFICQCNGNLMLQALFKRREARNSRTDKTTISGFPAVHARVKASGPERISAS